MYLFLSCLRRSACTHEIWIICMQEIKHTSTINSFFLWVAEKILQQLDICGGVFHLSKDNWQNNCTLFYCICNCLSTCSCQSFHKTSLISQRHCPCIPLELVECSRSCRYIWNEIIENRAKSTKNSYIVSQEWFFFFKLLCNSLRGKINSFIYFKVIWL